MNTTTLHYRKYLFMYGLISILMVLEDFEGVENFTECQKIIDSIREQEIRLECTFSTRINQKTIDEVIESYKKVNLTGKYVMENSRYYASLIMEEIKML